MPKEFLPGQLPGVREQSKEREVGIISSPAHPRQLRKGEVGLVKNTAYVGLGDGRYLTLGIVHDSGSEGATTTRIPPGGSSTTTPIVPGGANHAAQFNNAGSFGGFGTYDDALQLLTIAQMVATNYVKTAEVQADGDLTLKPTGDVVLPAGTAVIYNG
jgi:hypothetical protein